MGLFSALAPSVISGVAGLIGNKSTNKAQAEAAGAANAFTLSQLQNRHQWEVEDLRKAGLNPILSAGGTPSIGGSAKADVESAGEAVSRSVASALDVKKVQQEIDLLAQQRQESMSREALNDTQNFYTDALTKGVQLDNIPKGVKATVLDKVTGVASSFGNMVHSAGNLVKSNFQATGRAVAGRVRQLRN